VTLPTTDTIVLYPVGATTVEARVLHVQPLDDPDGYKAVLLDRTAFHPVDAAWPDQPSDRGVLHAGGVAIDVREVWVAATDVDGSLHVARIPARPGTEGWTFLVAHLVDGDAPVTEGDTVTVEIDPFYRDRLSAGHSACHLASLALNAALADNWTKEPRLDSLGSPDFDSAANENSTILERGARDTYRIGKSMRKSGFDPTALDDPVGLAASVNATLASWVATGGAISIERDGELLTDRRYWVADLPGGTARIACGGTHVTSLADLGAVTVKFETEQLEGAIGMTMLTQVG
jgi:alanyl-tRNA synthetase